MVNANPISHAKQFLVIAVIITAGLIFGSVVSADENKPAAASPKPTFIPPAITTFVPAVAKQSVVSPLPIIEFSPVSLKPSASPRPILLKQPVVAPTSPLPSKKRQPFNKQGVPFVWGINLKPFPFFSHDNDILLPEQFKLAKELGITTIRADYAMTNDRMNRLMIELAKEYQLKLIFIIPFGPNDVFTDPELYGHTYRYVYDIVSQYQGEVGVWQLANEVASVALADEHRHGIEQTDYPEARYRPVATWVKAATKAVVDADPKAKTLLTDQWVHTGFFERFLKEGGDFHFLGWNWFSDMGESMDYVTIDKSTGQTYGLMNKLSSFGKEIWLIEVNRRYGARDGDEQAQADYIEKMANYVEKHPYINGFFVFNLIGDQQAEQYHQDYGIVKVDKEKRVITGLRQAFWRYQELVRKALGK